MGAEWGPQWRGEVVFVLIRKAACKLDTAAPIEKGRKREKCKGECSNNNKENGGQIKNPESGNRTEVQLLQTRDDRNR